MAALVTPYFKEYLINACLNLIVCVIVFIYGNLLSFVIVLWGILTIITHFRGFRILFLPIYFVMSLSRNKIYRNVTHQL